MAPDVTAFDDVFTDDLVIRRVDRVDLLSVLHIERICFPEPWSYSAFEVFVDGPMFLVAARGDEVLSYVVADVMPNHGNDVGHVKNLAVRPKAHGNGLGRQLLVQSLTAITIAGATVMKLEVRVSNNPAIGLYRGPGLELARRVPSYYGDSENAYVMVLGVAGWQRA